MAVDMVVGVGLQVVGILIGGGGGGGGLMLASLMGEPDMGDKTVAPAAAG